MLGFIGFVAAAAVVAAIVYWLVNDKDPIEEVKKIVDKDD